MTQINTNGGNMNANELKSAYDYGYAYAEWWLDCGEFKKSGKTLEETLTEIGNRNSCTAPDIPSGDYSEMMRNGIDDNGTSYDYWEGWNDCILERIDSTPITLDDVKTAIENGSIEWRGDAVADNYGTDGGIRYQQEAILRGRLIRVYWDTTDEYNQWDGDCKLCASTIDGHDNSATLSGDLQERISTLADDDNIPDELIDDVYTYIDGSIDDARDIIAAYMRNNGDPRDNAYYTNDESNNCNWDNPISIDIID